MKLTFFGMVVLNLQTVDSKSFGTTMLLWLDQLLEIYRIKLKQPMCKPGCWKVGQK